jgi:hypothetical protein
VVKKKTRRLVSAERIEESPVAGRKEGNVFYDITKEKTQEEFESHVNEFRSKKLDSCKIKTQPCCTLALKK